MTSRERRVALIAVGGLLLLTLGIGVGYLVARAPGRASGSSGAADTASTQVQGAPALPKEPTPLKLDVAALPSFWVEVHTPSALLDAAEKNAWLQQALGEPLGKGFVGAWAALLGTRGEDLKAKFEGTVAQLMARRLVDGPFRAVWFAGEGATGAPAVVRDAPGAASGTAFAALDAAARRGTFVVERCPDETASDQTRFEVARWLIADNALYATTARGKLVLARAPKTVVQAVCAALPPLSPRKGHDVELVLSIDAQARETQQLAMLLGLGSQVRLALSVKGDQLEPRGLSGGLAVPARLDQKPFDKALLAALPADTPVLLAAQVRLPAALTAQALSAHFEGKDAGPLLTRQAALAWFPRGNEQLPTEIALLWSRREDRAALEALFSGKNKMTLAETCNGLVLSSTTELLQAIERACGGKVPNLRAAAGPVVQGLESSASIVMGINLGRALGQLIADGYWSETPLGAKAKLPATAPKEIDDAIRTLEALPYMGFQGKAEGAQLVPGGFRS